MSAPVYAVYLDGDRCSHYPEPGLGQCPNPAGGFLVTPDRTRAFRMCQWCAESTSAEYERHKELLGGIWTWEKGEAFGGPNPGRRIILAGTLPDAEPDRHAEALRRIRAELKAAEALRRIWAERKAREESQA